MVNIITYLLCNYAVLTCMANLPRCGGGSDNYIMK